MGLSAHQRLGIAMAIAARADITVSLDLERGYAVACSARCEAAIALPLHWYRSSADAAVAAIRGALAVAGQPHLISDILQAG